MQNIDTRTKTYQKQLPINLKILLEIGKKNCTKIMQILHYNFSSKSKLKNAVKSCKYYNFSLKLIKNACKILPKIAPKTTVKNIFQTYIPCIGGC